MGADELLPPVLTFGQSRPSGSNHHLRWDQGETTEKQETHSAFSDYRHDDENCVKMVPRVFDVAVAIWSFHLAGDRKMFRFLKFDFTESLFISFLKFWYMTDFLSSSGHKLSFSLSNNDFINQWAMLLISVSCDMRTNIMWRQETVKWFDSYFFGPVLVHQSQIYLLSLWCRPLWPSGNTLKPEWGHVTDDVSRRYCSWWFIRGRRHSLIKSSSDSAADEMCLWRDDSLERLLFFSLTLGQKWFSSTAFVHMKYKWSQRAYWFILSTMFYKNPGN